MLNDLDGCVDVVVSNPPYVPAGAVEDVETARYDPDRALFGGGEDGLAVPRAVVRRAAGLLRPGGVLVMEHDPRQSEELRDAALTAGFTMPRPAGISPAATATCVPSAAQGGRFLQYRAPGPAYRDHMTAKLGFIGIVVRDMPAFVGVLPGSGGVRARGQTGEPHVDARLEDGTVLAWDTVAMILRPRSP